MMRGLALALLAAAARANPPSDCSYTSISPGKLFGVGGRSTQGYADREYKCWKLRGNSHVTLVMDFFETERHYDELTVYDGNDVVAKYSGELVAPTVYRSKTNELKLVFKSDESSPAAPKTRERGFEASFFDSSDGACANGCSGQGTCVEGVCQCQAGRLGDDCSVPVTSLYRDQPSSVQGLKVSQWSYATYRFDVAGSYAVEVIDSGPSDSEPKLVVKKGAPPTRDDYDQEDWFASFYDFSDIHVVRGTANQGDVLYIGVVNDDVANAREDAQFTVAVRTAQTNQFPCLMQCNGHGTCDYSTGDCSCDRGWAGAVADRPDTCQFEIQKFERHSSVDEDLLGEYSGKVRMGNWDFYEAPYDLFRTGSKMLVEFYSKSPASYPVLLARRGKTPQLQDGWIPSLDTFTYDLTDEGGFDYVRGQRMSIMVDANGLQNGESWFFGVYNLWGHVDDDLDAQASRDDCEYTMQVSMFRAGIPCPSTLTADGGLFCGGVGLCDFNTGTCSCPEDRLWRDCSLPSTKLTPASGTFSPSLSGSLSGPGAAQYFHVVIDEAIISQKTNLVVKVDVTSRRRLGSGTIGSAPDPESGGTGSGISRGPPKAQLRANFEDVPFAGTTKNGVPTGKNRDDDLLDSYYGDKTLEVLLDAQELAAAGPGTWYFGVAADSSGVGSLNFRVSAELAAELACPVARGSGKVCDGAGQCRKHLGRCDCDAGAARDDCSADGVFALDGAATDLPAVPPDDWVYYRVIVGCEDRMLDVQFSFTAAGSGAKPRVYLRKGRLPLMLPETYDYVDLYTESGGWQQRIVASACGDTEFGCTAGETVKGNGCCVKQLYPGTAYANGAPEPGVYYVGIYNDASATQPLSGYSLSATVSSANAQNRGQPCGQCAEGFMGALTCSIPCPGVSPQDVYSNSPVAGESCSGHGQCFLDSSTGLYRPATCTCDGAVGDECELACPTDAEGKACSGHGYCQLMDGVGDYDGYGYGGKGPGCVCDAGRAGRACEATCPVGEGGQVCSGRGNCRAAPGGKPMCDCNAGFYGESCAYTCPKDDAGNTCGGHGQCVMAASIDICDYQDAAKRKRCEQDHIRCACDDGWKGKVCETEALTKKEKRASKKAFVALVMLLTALTIVSVCLSVYASRSQRRIANYERILAEGGQMGDAGRFEAPVPDEVPKIEMRKVGDARVSPLHYGDDAAEGV